MLGYLVVFVGAGVGGTIRHAMNIWIARFAGTHFPYHTLAINITGFSSTGSRSFGAGLSSASRHVGNRPSVTALAVDCTGGGG